MDRESNRGFVEAWQRAECALRAVRREELRRYSYPDAIAVFDSILDDACAGATPSLSSGLVRMQQILRSRTCR